MATETIKKINLSNRHDILVDGTDGDTRDCTETHVRNQPTEVVQLPPRKDPNQQAISGTHP